MRTAADVPCGRAHYGRSHVGCLRNGASAAIGGRPSERVDRAVRGQSPLRGWNERRGRTRRRFDPRRGGGFRGVLGPSGSGKTTLLNIIGALDSPSEGRVVMAGQDITRTSRKELFAFRRQGVSFVLQTAARRPRRRVPVRARHEPRRSRDREAGRGGPERARWRQGYGPLPDPHRAKQLSADLHNASGDGNPHQSAAIPLLHEPSGRGRHGPGRPCQPRLVHPRRRATCSRCETSVPCDARGHGGPGRRGDDRRRRSDDGAVHRRALHHGRDRHDHVAADRLQLSRDQRRGTHPRARHDVRLRRQPRPRTPRKRHRSADHGSARNSIGVAVGYGILRWILGVSMRETMPDPAYSYRSRRSRTASPRSPASPRSRSLRSSRSSDCAAPTSHRRCGSWNDDQRLAGRVARTAPAALAKGLQQQPNGDQHDRQRFAQPSDEDHSAGEDERSCSPAHGEIDRRCEPGMCRGDVRCLCLARAACQKAPRRGASLPVPSGHVAWLCWRSAPTDSRCS